MLKISIRLHFQHRNNLKSPANMNTKDFKNEFERLYDKQKSMTGCCLRECQHMDCQRMKRYLRMNNSQRNTVTFTYDDMKKQLKAIYGNLSTNKLKVERTYEVKTYEKSDKLDGYSMNRSFHVRVLAYFSRCNVNVCSEITFITQ